MFPLYAAAAAAASSPEQQQAIAEGLEKHPLPTFLALLIGAIMVLWGTISTLFWWGSRGRERLHRENYTRELERNQELRKERDEAREQADRENRERVQLAMQTVATAAGLSAIRADLDKRAALAAEERDGLEEERKRLQKERRALTRGGSVP